MDVTAAKLPVATTLAASICSTGTVVRGYVSPYSDDADHIRLNPEDESMHEVIVLQHVVRIRRIVQRPRRDGSP